jgi:TolB-like protein
MNRFGFLSLLGALASADPAAAQAGPVVMAILPFEDRGSYGQDKEVFRALQLGLPAALASELSRNPGVRLADRNRVSQALQSQNLGPNARVDAATAAKVGKQTGSRYVVTGNFADFYGKFRIDARIIDTDKDQILKVVSNNDPALQDRAALAQIITSLAGKIAQAVNVPPSAADPQRAGVPTEALTQYSLGLLYESQGDKGKASEHYQRALTAYAEYPDAREAIQRVRR